MRVLALDPGAKRMGWAVLDDGPLSYVDSGVTGIERGATEDYQPYRLRLIEHFSNEAHGLLGVYEPDVVVSEIIPVKGGGQFISAAQSQLAATAVTAFQAIAVSKGYALSQLGSTTVKKKIGGSNKASKVTVRNGVTHILEMPRKATWTKVFDESDACAIGLTYLGYANQG